MMKRLLSLAAVTTFAIVATVAPVASSHSDTATPDASDAPDLSQLRFSTAHWKTDFTKASVDLGEILGGGPRKDAIPAIDEPRFESIEAARGWLEGQSPVISLEVDGVARAYPMAILLWHEIVNDTIGDTPVVVSFCPICAWSLVFERESDGVTYDFGTTGNLRFGDLLMYDRQTESWWQQGTGQAIVGELTGTPLRFLVSQILSLDDFATAHPDAEVLSRKTGYQKDYGHNPYIGYDRADQPPFMFGGIVDGRLAPKERVVSVGEGADTTAIPFSELRKVGIATATVQGDDIVVFWMPGTASPLDSGTVDRGRDIGAVGVFRPRVEDQALTFQRSGQKEDAPIVDVETGSTWSITGRAIDGPLAGSQLEPLAYVEPFWYSLAAFAPEATIWTAP